MEKKELNIKVKALVNIKYDGKVYEADKVFKVSDIDSLEMENRGFIEIIGEVKPRRTEPPEGEEFEENENIEINNGSKK